MIKFPNQPTNNIGVVKVPVIMLPVFPEVGVLGEIVDHYNGKWYTLHEIIEAQLMIEEMIKEAQRRGSNGTNTQPTE